jgi:serine/threonine protein kinase
VSLDQQAVADALPSYEVLGELGRGGSGIVLEGRHRDLDRPVAIKQLPRAFGADPEVRRRFQIEARTVARLDHPHIVPVYDFVERDGLCLLVMELLPGGTVWDEACDEGLTSDRASAYVLAAAVAAHAAHTQGVLHRDIKPENLLIAGNGVPKLADFGLAKVLDSTAPTIKTRQGVVLGTPAYIAPEQITGDGLGPATDVYALATMAYELLTGQLPFPATDSAVDQLRHHLESDPRPFDEVRNHDVPAGVGAVVMAGLARSPGGRPATAEAFAVDLARAVTSGLGPGWLDRSGVALLGAGRVGSATQAGSTSHRPVRPTASIRAASVHLQMPPAALSSPESPTPGDEIPETPSVPIDLPNAEATVMLSEDQRSQLAEAARHAPSGSTPQPPRPVPGSPQPEPEVSTHETPPRPALMATWRAPTTSEQRPPRWKGLIVAAGVLGLTLGILAALLLR